MGPKLSIVAKILALGLAGGAAAHLLSGHVFGYMLVPLFSLIGF